MENNFICFTCQNKPVQFTILHCDHIICSKCLDNSLTKLKQISMVQCRCGLKTYCNEDSMRLSLRTPEMMEVKKELLNIKELQNENTRISHFLINESEISSKDNTFLRNKENINNQNQKCSFNPAYSYSKCFLKTQPMNIEDSNPFFPDEKKNIGSNRKIATGVKSVQSIKSMSPSQKVSEKVSPKKIKRKQSPKNVLSLYSSNSAFSSDVLNYVAKQLQKQLKFLWIQYEKQISACQKTFKSILKSITTSYESLVSSVERFYLDQATQIDINDKDQLILGLPKVIKKKYDSSVGSKITYLNQKLLESFETIGPKKAFEAQRYVRETVFVAQDIGRKKEKTLSKNEGQKSKSKRKIKQCALYLAISPKNKNDKVVNYIDVIKKEVKTSKNGNLVKRTKGEKIRIY